MELKSLMKVLQVQNLTGTDDLHIQSIAADSRKVTDGSLFVAVKGTASDGHDYIPVAIANGARAIVCEVLPAALSETVTYIVVPDTAEALGKLASAWYEFPSDNLVVVGVTGTNGKTTIATLLYDMFRKMGHKAGLLSTVCNYIDGEAVPATHTTPDALTLHELMARMVDAGCEYLFMEVSSHAVDQKRISGISFDGGIFTNLTASGISTSSPLMERGASTASTPEGRSEILTLTGSLKLSRRRLIVTVSVPPRVMSWIYG